MEDGTDNAVAAQHRGCGPNPACLTFDVRLTMKESIYPLLVFLGISVGTSCLVHMRQAKMWRAACISASISIVAFIAVGAVIQGFLDPFWPIALVIGGMMSFAISVVVGVIVRSVLKRRRSDVLND